ncbi:MAG: 16S rRNA (guanine(527)-N(7))-methyltransferase RsmG, partial [Bacteroidota bacterium]|nr:16S rRNA (guanine(527)-N(7))-methyltransferase RsmG [Bacteroidota bacterium]
HVLHSLSIASIFKFKARTEILDIGTGGGFPGIPLAIFFPEVQFYLADSIAKKLKVVQAVSLSIGLKNVTTLHNRAEPIKNNFDFVVSRAVAPLKNLWTWSKPLIKTKSQIPNPKFHNGLICLKGGDLAKEIQESKTKPQIIEIEKIFKEEFFKKKYILYITS